MRSLDRPILITGTPRSGKSFLAKMIRCAEEFGWVREPQLIWNRGMRGRPDDQRTAEEASDAWRRYVLRSCRRALKKTGRRRYVEDLSYHALRIPFVHAVLPEARIIHVIRDPREAIPEMLHGWTYRQNLRETIHRRRQSISLNTLAGLPEAVWRFARNMWSARVHGRRRSYGPRVPGMEEFASQHTLIELVAYQWQQLTAFAIRDLQSVPEDRQLEIRHEDISAHPESIAARLTQFIEPEDEKALEKSFERAFDQDLAKRVADQRVVLTPEQWASIWPIVGSVAEKLGYVPPGTIASDGGHVADQARADVVAMEQRSEQPNGM